MNEKGQIKLLLAGLLSYVSVFVIGWFLGQQFGGFSYTNPTAIEIVPKGQITGDVHFSPITVNNCDSTVDSMAHETREFSYQHLLTFLSQDEIKVEVQNAIALRLQQEGSFQRGEVFTVRREFDFISPPRKITVHKIKWTEQLSEGIARVGSKEYQYSYPIDVEVDLSSEHKACSTP